MIVSPNPVRKIVATFARGRRGPCATTPPTPRRSARAARPPPPSPSRSAARRARRPAADSPGTVRRGSGTRSRAAAPGEGRPGTAPARRPSRRPRPRSADRPPGEHVDDLIHVRRPRPPAPRPVVPPRLAARPLGRRRRRPLRKRRGLPLRGAVRRLQLVAQPIALALQAIPLLLQPIAVALHGGLLPLQPRDLAQQLLARFSRAATAPPRPQESISRTADLQRVALRDAKRVQTLMAPPSPHGPRSARLATTATPTRYP